MFCTMQTKKGRKQVPNALRGAERSIERQRQVLTVWQSLDPVCSSVLDASLFLSSNDQLPFWLQPVGVGFLLFVSKSPNKFSPLSRTISDLTFQYPMIMASPSHSGSPLPLMSLLYQLGKGSPSSTYFDTCWKIVTKILMFWELLLQETQIYHINNVNQGHVLYNLPMWYP